MNRITIFHYHLLPGGVTNVILLGATALIRHFPDLKLIRLVCGREENTGVIRESLEREIEKAGLTGGSLQLEICIEPAIDYNVSGRRIAAAETDSLAQKLLNRFGDSFWWVHNYQLGKNPLFTAAVVHTAKNYPHQKMLLHIHDFPECARFDNLNTLFSAGFENPYPVSDNAAYALINGRDADLLQAAGVPADRVNLLNNPVEEDSVRAESLSAPDAASLKRDLYEHFSSRFPGINPEAKMLLYPVRTIRRKNVLEAGLIAAVSEQPVNLVVSLPGISVQEKEYSDTCERAFSEGLIPGIWGSGAERSSAVPSYPMMLQLCDMIISSSVQEGFGYLFINSVQLGIPLVARDLDILNGIRDVFPQQQTSFYTEMRVPIENELILKLRSEYLEKLESLSCYFTASALESISSAVNKFGADGTIDFSFLDVEQQQNLLRKLGSSAGLKKEIQDLNRKLMQSVYTKLSDGRYNPEIDMDRFSLKAHSDAVLRIIKSLEVESMEQDDKSGMIQQNLLDRFAEPQYMRLLYD